MTEIEKMRKQIDAIGETLGRMMPQVSHNSRRIDTLETPMSDDEFMKNGLITTIKGEEE